MGGIMNIMRFFVGPCILMIVASAAAQLWFQPQASLIDIEHELERTQGAHVDDRNSLGQTGLMQAINYDQATTFGNFGARTDLVRLLIKYGADVNARSIEAPREEDHSFDNTALHYVAIQTNFLNTIPLLNYLVDEGGNINLKNSLGETPLMWTANLALLDDKRTITKAFIENLADVNLQNNIGDTYLHILINNKDFNWVQELLDTFGSMFELSIKNSEGWTALDYAKNTLQPESVRAINSIRLIGEGDKDKQLRVKERDILGRTGLMLAIIRNDMPFAVKQIEKGSDVNARDTTRFANAPLHLSVIRRNTIMPFVSLLLQHGADPSIQNDQKDTPLHYLVRFNAQSPEFESVAQAFINAGADLTIINGKGRSVLDEAKRINPSLANNLKRLYEEKKRGKEKASKVPEHESAPMKQEASKTQQGTLGPASPPLRRKHAETAREAVVV